MNNVLLLSFDRIISQIFADTCGGDLLHFMTKPHEGDPVGTTIM